MKFEIANINADIWNRINEINAELAKEKIKFDGGELPNSLGIIVGDLLTDWLIMRDIKRTLKNKITYAKDGEVYTCKAKPTAINLIQVKKASWWKETNILLNCLSPEQARPYFG